MLGVAACRVSFSTTHRLIFVEGSALEGSAGRYDCKKENRAVVPGFSASVGMRLHRTRRGWRAKIAALVDSANPAPAKVKERRSEDADRLWIEQITGQPGLHAPDSNCLVNTIILMTYIDACESGTIPSRCTPAIWYKPLHILPQPTSALLSPLIRV